MEREVELMVGGKKIPLNEFVRDVTVNIILGLLRSLKKVDPSQEIRLTVGPARE